MGMTIDTSLLYESGYNKGFKDGIKGSIPKDQYEARLKTDKLAMLTEIQLEIEEKASTEGDWIFAEGERFCAKLIQQKIENLKGGNK